MVSNAIRGLLPQGRRPIPPLPATSAEAPPATPAPQQPTAKEQQPLTPREAAFLEQMREERARRQELERRYAQPQPQQPQQNDLATRLFESPEEVLGQMQQSFAMQIAQVRLDNDLNLAAVKHGDKFNSAFNDFMQHVGDGRDAQTYFRVMNSQSPGEEIVRWHRETSVLREVGEDPQAYRDRVRQELLAELQGQQPQAPPAPPKPRNEDGTFKPRHEVRLPTATSRLPGATSAANDGADDGSEDAIFEAARPSRRR